MPNQTEAGQHRGRWIELWSCWRTRDSLELRGGSAGHWGRCLWDTSTLRTLPLRGLLQYSLALRQVTCGLAAVPPSWTMSSVGAGLLWHSLMVPPLYLPHSFWHSALYIVNTQ